MARKFSGQIFEKYSDTKFNENPSSESPVVPYRQADGHTHVHEGLVVASPNLANAPEK
jgi:hypothetical protein